MKITSVEVMRINSAADMTGGKGDPFNGKKPVQKKKGGWHPIILRINTDEGIYGYGEVALAYGVGCDAGFGMAKDLAAMIIGMDPMDNEAIWHKMRTKTFWGLAGGAVVFAGMSGIDMALWDIKGKALGVPLYVLLGGKCREDLRCYASQIQFDWGVQGNVLIDPQQYAEAALKAVADGYDAVKVDALEFDPEGRMKALNLRGPLSLPVINMAVARVEAIREAVGDGVDIIIENHGETDVVSAIQYAKALEPYGIYFYEEVVGPMNPAMHREMKEKVNIPIAGGERIFSRWGYAPFFADRSLDVIQPDLGTCGGITEGKKICDMAHTYDMTVQTHVCGSPIYKAASLHLEIAIPNFCIHEHHRVSLLPENIAMCKYDYQPVNGRYKVPELPGIGQELTEETYQNAYKEVVTG